MLTLQEIEVKWMQKHDGFVMELMNQYFRK